MLYGLSEAQKTVVDNAVPELVNARVLETEFRDLLVLFGALRNTDTVAEVESARAVLERKLQDIRRNLAAILPVSAHDSEVTGVMKTLEQLEGSLEQRERVQTSLLVSKRILDSIRGELQSMKSQFAELIQPEIINLSIALDSLSRQYQPDDAPAVSKRIDAYTQSSQLKSQTDSALDQAINLTETGTLVGKAEKISQLRFALNQVAESLVYIENSTLKSEMAGLTQTLYRRSFTDGGISESLEKFERAVVASESIARAESELIAKLSDWIQRNTKDTVEEVNVSSQDVRRRLGTALLSAVLLAILVAAVLLLVNRFILEKQIHSRMSDLTDAVLAIAAEQTDHPVSVRGSDEIGKIADALSIFKRNIVELRRSNDELSQFAYAASHDMKSPLSAIGSLADWIIEDSIDALPAESRENLLLLRRRVDRLAALQSDLLEYAQAGTEQSNLSSFNVSHAIEQIADLVDPTGQFRIKCNTDVNSVETYVIPLQQVLTNLISNAVKHHDRESGKIVVGVQQRGKWLHISVKDDGPGVEKSYQEEIFRLFKRLQSQDKVEGSGLGLSMVKKLVSRYDGTVAVISDPDVKRGTEFLLVWPCNN